MFTETRMDEAQAEAVAEALGGSAWQSGGDIWLVITRRADGKVVAISDEVVCEYDSEEALGTGKPSATMVLH